MRQTTSTSETSSTNLISSFGQGKRTAQARTTFWIAGVLLGSIFFLALYNFYFYLNSGAWQLLTVAIVEGIYVGIIVYAIWLNRTGRRGDLDKQLLVGGLLMVAIVSSVTLANVGLVIGLSVVLVTWIITAQTKARRWSIWALIGAFIVGIITGTMELFPLPSQLVVPGLQAVTPVLAVIVVVAYILLIIWQFKSYDLRTKFITAFLVISVLSVGSVAFRNTLTMREVLITDVGLGLANVAKIEAQTVGNLLLQQVDRLQTLGLNKLFQDQVEARNAAYPDEPAAAQAEVEALDQQWSQANIMNPLVLDRLTGILATELTEFQTTFPDHIEVLVTDRYGGLVSATARPGDYYQGDKEWWQTAYNEGQGSIFVGQPQFDEGTATFGLILAVPVYAHNSQEVVGVLRSTYRMAPLQDLLGSIQVEQTGGADLYLPGGSLLRGGEAGLTQADSNILTQLNSLAQLQATGTAQYARFPYNQITSLISQAPVQAVTQEGTAIENLGWTLVVHQAEQEALAPVQLQLRETLFLALVIVGVVAGVAVLLSQLLAGPITRLTTVAQQVAAGDLNVRGRVESEDEIGQLTVAFNTMTRQLQEIIGTLEERVAGRTRQLETVVEVSHRLAGILDLSDLLRQVVTLTRETFNYYHVHIYLLEDETLIMAEGYGKPGAEMKRQGHSISLKAEKSLVARAAREAQVVTVRNVQEDPHWLPNPLLPDTKSEMAIPVMIGQEVVGILDVQSDKADGLTQEDETTLQALANQVAIAVRNARAFAQTQEALYRAQRLQRLYTAEAWERFRTARPTTDFEFRQPALPPLQEVNTPEVMAALEQEQTITLLTNGQAKTDSEIDKELASAESQSEKSRAQNALATPLKLRDEIIGVLGIHDDDPDRRWTDDEIALIEAVSQQMSLAIENARLFEHTQRDAWRNQTISETTAQVWASDEIEAVMKAAVAQLGEKLNASEVVIRLGTGLEDEES